MTKYLRENREFCNLSDIQKSLISHAVNTLGDTGVYVTPESCGFVSESHVLDCVERSLKHLTPEGLEVVQEIFDTLHS